MLDGRDPGLHVHSTAKQEALYRNNNIKDNDKNNDNNDNNNNDNNNKTIDM
jgi:hypothetical protein